MTDKPGIIQRARLALEVYRQGLPQRKASPISWSSWRSGQPLWQITDTATYIREGFNMNALIYSAIMYKAKALSSVPLRAYTGERDAPEVLPDDAPLSQLLMRPNPSQSWREFQMLQTVYLNLSGNAYAFMDRKAGQISQIVPLNPLRTYIIPKGRNVIGYLYVPEGQAMQDGIPMLAEDVSHVKFPNPGDDLDGFGYGLSPLSAAAQSADVDNKITEFLKIFFASGTSVNTVLQFDTILDDRDVARIRTRWEEIYGGVQNWGKVGVLDQQGEAKNLGYSFDEMGFETLDERNEARILQCFGVPPILIGSRLGLARSTYSNYEQAYNAFWMDTMLHEARLFEDDYAYYLQDGNAWVALDFSDVPAFQDDISGQVAAWKELVMLGVPKAQAADVVGLNLGQLEDGDVAYMPLGLVPLQEAAQARQANRDALAEARNSQNSQNSQSDQNSDSTPPDATDDERKTLTVTVKKNSAKRNGASSGNHGTPLIGVTKASSRMRQKQHSNGIGEKSSAG